MNHKKKDQIDRVRDDMAWPGNSMAIGHGSRIDSPLKHATDFYVFFTQNHGHLFTG